MPLLCTKKVLLLEFVPLVNIAFELKRNRSKACITLVWANGRHLICWCSALRDKLQENAMHVASLNHQQEVKLWLVQPVKWLLKVLRTLCQLLDHAYSLPTVNWNITYWYLTEISRNTWCWQKLASHSYDILPINCTASVNVNSNSVQYNTITVGSITILYCRITKKLASVPIVV